MKTTIRILFGMTLFAILAGSGMARVALAASAGEIDTRVNGTLDVFKAKVPGGAEFLDKASGALVFPEIIKGGLIIGGEFGEGALRVAGQTADYYNIASASFGFQIGAQQYSIVMVFLSDEALQEFRDSKGWEAGVDGSVAVAEWGAGDDINTKTFKDPIVAFVFGNKGLMAGVSIEGSKITKIEK
jgi:lipid-binding SYLF domain-containing protein